MKTRTIFRTLGRTGLLFLLWLGSGSAQWSAALSTYQAYDENPFNYRDAGATWVSTTSITLSYLFNGLTASYSGSAYRFDLIPDRNAYWHQAGLSGGTQQRDWGIELDQQINREAYSIYDYFSGRAYVQQRMSWRGFYSTALLSLSGTRYTEIPELNNTRLLVSLNFNRGFATRTALLGGFSYQFKQYTQDDYLLIDQDTAADALPSDRGFGRRMAATPRYLRQEAPSASLLSLWLRLTQSITSKTGLAVQYQQQFSLSGSSRYLTGLSGDYSGRTELFDDPVGYEGHSMRLMLTQLLPAGTKFRGGFTYRTKDYIEQGIYLDAENYSSETLRKDTLRSAWVYLEKPFRLQKKRNSPVLNIFLQYSRTDNQSNSYWYDFSGDAWSMGLELDF